MRLIATDLDGTLLNAHAMVSPENIQAIKDARSKGLHFVVATGRSYDAAQIPLKAAGIKCPIITLNGANIFDEEGQLLHEVPMPFELCHEILLKCRELEMYVEFFTNKGMYSASRDNVIEMMTALLTNVFPDRSPAAIQEIVNHRFQSEMMTFLDCEEDIFSIAGIKIYKMLAFSAFDDRLGLIFDQFVQHPELAVTSSGHSNVEFNHIDAQKGIAVETLVRNYGIGMQDVMALGDSLNDKNMLEMAGHGVAMGNASDEIKSISQFVTKTNVEHGFAYAVETLLKLA